MDKIDGILKQWRREKPEMDTGPMGLVGRMRRYSRFLGKEMERTFAAHGLNGPGFDVLATLRRSGPPYSLSPGALMESTMVTSGTMTNRIDQLVKAGLVERKRDAKDGRSVRIALTDLGREKIDLALEDHARTQARLIAPFDAAEREMLDALLRKGLTELEGGPK